MEILELEGTLCPCFINFDNVDFFYCRVEKIEDETCYFTQIELNNNNFQVEEDPETILLSLKKNKFIEFIDEDFSLQYENDLEMADGKFYVNINSIEMVRNHSNDTSIMNVKKNLFKVKGTIESIYLKLKTLK
jgi:hypothetical protein